MRNTLIKHLAWENSKVQALLPRSMVHLIRAFGAGARPWEN
ncbi:hypothetical protein [Alkalicoccobacillus plakortidis]|nr:hypothetical protein [Alkalicoccobacillus plakortidis]